MPSTKSIVTIDPSTTSTALCIDGNLYSIAVENKVLTKSGANSKWFEFVSPECKLFTYPAKNLTKVFSHDEVEKLRYFKQIESLITDIICRQTDPANTTVYIEGFSYDSAAGHLIDLVTLSTLIRNTLYCDSYTYVVVPPTTLKTATARLCYEGVDVGKRKPKIEYRNHDGMAGGRFKKGEMLQAILDSKIDHSWKDHLAAHSSDLTSLAKVPNPVEDLNDAFLLYQIACEDPAALAGVVK